MNYIIHTPSARRLKDEILGRVSDKVDGNGTDCADKALVLTEGQWAEKGCVTLTQVAGTNDLQVRFHYWETWEKRDNGDDKYILGRFTELILVHFSYFIDKIVIE